MRVSNFAHLFSMRTNGLSLKPRDRLPPGRLIHRGHGAPRKFFATVPGGGKTFSRPFGALDGRSRNQAVTSPTGARAFVSAKEIMSLINQAALADSCKRRLRTGSPMLMSSCRLELACSEVRDVFARDRKSTRLNSSHIQKSRMPSSA